MTTRPADKLTEPQAKETIPGPIDQVLSIGDWLNVSHWVMQAIELVTGGLNPGQWVVDQFTGDWEAFSKAGDTIHHLGEFYAT